MKKLLFVTIAVMLVSFTSLFGVLFLSRVRMEYKAEGNFFDEHASVVYHEQAVGVYGVITLILLFVTLFTILKMQKTVFKK